MRWWDSQAGNAIQDRCKQVLCHRHLGQLERNVSRVPDNFRSNLDKFLTQSRKGPTSDGPWQNQASQEISQVVS